MRGRCNLQRMVRAAPSPWCPHVRAKGMWMRRGATQAGEPRANGRMGTPKRDAKGGQQRMTVHPRVRARCANGAARERKGGRTKAGVQKGAGDGRRRTPRACKGGGCASGAGREWKGAHTLSAPPRPVDRLRKIPCNSVLSNIFLFFLFLKF